MLTPWMERLYELLLALVILAFNAEAPPMPESDPDALPTATPFGYVATPTPCPADLLEILGSNSVPCAMDVLTAPLSDDVRPTATPLP